MQIHDILAMADEEEVRKLNIHDAVIIWSGPHTFTEASKRSGGGLYVIVKKGSKPLYVGQTGNYKSRFSSRLHVLRIAACDLSRRGVYLGRIVKPASRAVNKNLRLDIESVLIRSYLRRGHKLVNRSSIRTFIMGPRDAIVSNEGNLPPQMKKKIIIKGNSRFELSYTNGSDELLEFDSNEIIDFELLTPDEEIRRKRRPQRMKRPIRKIRPSRPKTLTGRPRPPRRNRRPRRRPTMFRQQRRLLRPNEPCINSPGGTELVRWVQNSLNQILGLRLRINGVMNRATRDALRNFQKREGLPVDGIAGPETKQALIAARSSQIPAVSNGAAQEEQFLGSLWGYTGRPKRKKSRSTRRRIRPSSQSQSRTVVDRNSREYIKWVQQALNTVQGLRLSVDGILGPMTRSAVRTFQKQRGLVVDGIIGPLTENALIAAGASRPGDERVVSYIPTAPLPGRPPLRQPGSQRFVTVSSTAITNPQIDRIVDELENYFGNANLKVTLTSAIRTPEEQLGIIQRKAIQYGLDTKYPSIRTATVSSVESWLDAWDELLNNKGYIVNPPQPVTSRITGKPYGISPHMKGQAVDLSGADLNRIAAVVQSYCQQGGVINQILIERINNAVHVGIRSKGDCQITG